MPVDYLKIYHRMVADVPLVKVRQNSVDQQLVHYIDRLLLFRELKDNVYAFTISPKSSPLLKNKSIKAQYVLLVNYLRNTLPLYGNKYISIFETYSDNINLHCHGMLCFRTLDDIVKFKRDARQHFNIKLKERETDKLTHVKQLGYDLEARCRWIGYCYKELRWAIKNELMPIFRWDDEYIKPLEHPKPKRGCTQEYAEALSVEQQRQIFNEDPSSFLRMQEKMKEITLESYSDTRSIRKKSMGAREYNNWASALDFIEPEEEIETEDSSEEPDKFEELEYLQYMRLKDKFEKKTSSNFII